MKRVFILILYKKRIYKFELDFDNRAFDNLIIQLEASFRLISLPLCYRGYNR